MARRGERHNAEAVSLVALQQPSLLFSELALPGLLLAVIHSECLTSRKDECTQDSQL